MIQRNVPETLALSAEVVLAVGLQPVGVLGQRAQFGHASLGGGSVLGERLVTSAGRLCTAP